MNCKITNGYDGIILFVLFLFSTWNAAAQCPEGRLEIDLFTYERDTVYYGSNTNVLGDTVDLYMDIYSPENDTFEKRPVVIFAFGGGFVSGERNDFIMSSLCQEYARKGYIAATIDYRLFPDEELGSPDSLELIDANIKAVSDMKAAIRYFRQSADNGNPYKVDPDFIVVGGYSAGAFTALHHTYLDEEDPIPMHIENIIETNGGFNGNTGDSLNQQFSSEVNACMNFAGALYDTTFLNEGEPPIFSYHGTDDAVVPITTGRSVNTVTTMGSELITQRAINENVPHVFYAVQGAGHVDMWFDFIALNTFMNETNSVLREMYCSSLTDSRYAKERKGISVYPNPTSGRIFLKLDDPLQGQLDYRLVSINGSIIQHGKVANTTQYINLSNVPEGVYWIEIPGYLSQKILVQY